MNAPTTASLIPSPLSPTVVIDGVEIPEFLIAQEVQNHPSLSAAEARKAAGKALAVRALLLHRADELGLEAQPQRDEAGREETPEEALIRAVLDAEVEIDPPSDAVCRRVYDSQRARFTSPVLIEAAHILIEPRDAEEDSWEVARQTAEEIATRLAAGPSAFAAVAKVTSDCPSKEVGGSLGQLGPGDIARELEAALIDLEPGQVLARPVRSRFGWHVIKLDRRIEGRELPFEFVIERIRLNLESRAWTAAATRYVSDLAARARAQGVAFSLTRDGRFGGGLPSLGEMLADDAPAERLESWLDASDPDLAGRVREAARAAGQDFAAFVRGAVAGFVTSADDEAWTRLISAAQGGEDPAVAALAALLKSRLTPKARTYTIVRRK
jgi:peptidyl-prolyl cis-trans isomerase C